MNLSDSNNRKLEEVVGVALNDVKPEDRSEILNCLENHRQWRLAEEERRNSLEEENIDIDRLHKLKVFDSLTELVMEFKELQVSEQTKLKESST